MNVGKLFYDMLEFNGEEATYNNLTFIVNKQRTHFNATIIMNQCSYHLGSLDKKGLPSKTWSDMSRGKNGQTIAYYETKEGRRLFRWVEFKDLLPVLTYSMGDGNTVNKFLNNEEWADSSGYVYLVKCVVNNETIFKYGHSWDVEQRMKGYKRECDSYELFASCKVNDMLDVEAAIGEYIFSHGGNHHPRGVEWFTYSSIVDADMTAFDDWIYAVFLCDDSYRDTIRTFVDF